MSESTKPPAAGARALRHVLALVAGLVPLPLVWLLDTWLLGPSPGAFPLDFRGVLIGVFGAWWISYALVSTGLGRGLALWRYVVSGFVALVGMVLLAAGWLMLDGMQADRAFQEQSRQALALADTVELVRWNRADPGVVVLRFDEPVLVEVDVAALEGHGTAYGVAPAAEVAAGEEVRLVVEFDDSAGVGHTTHWAVHARLMRADVNVEVEWRDGVTERIDEELWSWRPLPP